MPTNSQTQPYKFKINGQVKTFYASSRNEAHTMAVGWTKKTYGKVTPEIHAI